MSSHCVVGCLHLREIVHSQQHILICNRGVNKENCSTALCVRTGVEIVLCIYSIFPLLFQGVSLGDIAPLPRSINDGMNSPTHYNVNFSEAVSHDVSLHEAMLRCSDNTFRRDPVARTSQPQEQILQLSSITNTEQTLPGTNLTGFLPFVDNQMRNLSQDHLYDLDINILDETNLMSLATGFDPMEVSWLLEEPGYDSGLSLDSSNNSTSVIKSNSSHSICEGATGSSSDLSHHDLEGAVGGYCPEPSKLCPMQETQETQAQSLG